MPKNHNQWEQYAIAAMTRINHRTVKRWVDNPDSVYPGNRERLEKAAARLKYAQLRKLLGLD